MDDFTNLTQDSAALANPSGETPSDEGPATSPKPTTPKFTPKMKKTLIATGSSLVVIVVAILLVVHFFVTIPQQEAAAEQARLEQEQEQAEQHQAAVDAFTKATEDCDAANKSLTSEVSSAQTTATTDPATMQDSTLIDTLNAAITTAQAVPPCAAPTMADDTDTITQQVNDLTSAVQTVLSAKNTLVSAENAVPASVQAKKRAEEAAAAAAKAAEEAAARAAEEAAQKAAEEAALASLTTVCTYDNGYSLKIQVKPYPSYKGTDSALAHPGKTDVSIPAAPNTSIIIPFQVTFTNTTPSSEYTSDFSFNIGGTKNSFNLLVHKYVGGSWELQRMGETNSRIWRDTTAGFTSTVLGYVEITNYYSPNYPDGNVDMLDPSWGPDMDFDVTASLTGGNSWRGARLTVAFTPTGNGIALTGNN